MFLNLIYFLLTPFLKNYSEEIKRNKIAQKVLKLYGDSKFAKIRFWDAPFLEVEKIIPSSGKILDLGCGEGIFTNYLGLTSPLRKITGIEIDYERIKEVRKHVENVEFKYGDVTKIDIPTVDCIIMFHLLHHLPSLQDQGNLIKRCYGSLSKGGKLIIVEVEPGISLKYLLAWFTDHFLVPWIFEKRFYSKIFFRKSKDWKYLIESFGFSCTIKNVEQGKPFSHVILQCKKL